jgi:hypothetical protein
MKQSQYTRGDAAKPRSQRFQWNTVLMILSGFFLVILCLFVVNQQSEYVNLGYEVTLIREENRLLRERQLQLRAERERLASPERVYRESIEQGLMPIPAGQRFRVRIIDKPEEQLTEEESLVAMRTETSVP